MSPDFLTTDEMSIDQLRAAAALVALELREARVCLREQDERLKEEVRNRLIEFEGIGKLYEARFHRLRPGKDDKLRDSMDEDNIRQFSDWIRCQALTDAIFRIVELEKQLQVLGGES